MPNNFPARNGPIIPADQLKRAATLAGDVAMTSVSLAQLVPPGIGAMERGEQVALLYVMQATLEAMARKADIAAALLGDPLFGHFEADFQFAEPIAATPRR